MGLRLALIICLIIGLWQNIGLATDLMQAPAAIQVTSFISDGKYSLQEIISIIRKNRIKVLSVTDRDLMRWEYGLWPLRNILKRTIEEKSVFKYGIKAYLKDLKELQEKNPDIILIPGIESAPYYFWEGSFLKASLKLRDWHKHILVLGMENPEDYKQLPVAGNQRGLRLGLTSKNILLFWPILLILVSAFFLNHRLYDYKDEKGRRLGPYSKAGRISGFALLIIGLLFLYNNYPFYYLKFDQYQRYPGVMPYQNFIDYVNKKGGLAFWAHPHAENIERISGIEVITPEYLEYLLKTYNYSGFVLLSDGYEKLGKPGGVWDQVLLEYCQDKRKKPVWAIAGLGFDLYGDLSQYLNDLRNVFLLNQLDRKQAFEALKNGRLYLAQGSLSSSFILNKFILKDNLNSAVKTMGDELEARGKYGLEIGGFFLDGQKRPFNIKLIRNGEVIKNIDIEDSFFDLLYTEEENLGRQKVYYRVEIRANGLFIITNPIFVKQR